MLFSSSFLRGKGISQNRQHLFRIKPAVLLISALLIFRGPLLSLAHLSKMASNLLCSQEYLQLLILLLLPPRVLPDTVPFILLIRLIIPTHIHTLPPTSATQKTTNKNKNTPSIWSFLSYCPYSCLDLITHSSFIKCLLSARP